MIKRQDLLLVAALVLIAAPAAADNNAVIEDVLVNDLAGSTDPDIVTIQNAFAAAATEDEASAVLEAASPIVHGGEAEAIRSINRQTFGLINQRLAMLRGDEAAPARTGEDKPVPMEAWWQVYGSGGTQDMRGGIDGYKSTVYGIAAGLEAELAEDGFLGFSLAWGETDAESKGPGDPATNTDSYMLGLYGDYDFGRAYANAMLSYGYNDIGTARISAAGKRTANFHAGYYAARAEAGMAFMPGKTRVIPKLIAHYSYYSPDAYTEEGPAAQHVAGDSQKTFELGAAVDLNWLAGNGEGSYFVPAMRFGYRYDLIREPVAYTAQFVAGGPAFTVQGFDPSRHTLDFGLGMTYVSRDDWELLFDYDLEYKKDYIGHAGMVRASYKFAY